MDLSNAKVHRDGHVTYDTLINEVYDGHLPVVIFMGDQNFWVIFDPPESSRLLNDSQFDRQTHITRLTGQVGAAAWHMRS